MSKKKKRYKWVINCDITVIAKGKKEAIEAIKHQLINEPDFSDIEPYSKYNKFGKAKRVKWLEEW